MKNNVDITFHPSWFYENAGIEFDEKFFFDAKYRVEADVKMRRALYEHFGAYGIGEKDPKPRPILFSDLLACGFLYSQILGCEIVFQKDNAPQVMPANFSEEDINALQAPNLDEHPIWQKIQSQIDYFLDEFGYVESAINLMGIQNIALDLRGEDFFYDCFDDPDLADKLLTVITDMSIDIGKRLYAVSPVISAGVTSIIKQACPSVYLTSNCSVTMISDAQYNERLLKHDTRLANEFGCFGIHHCGSNTENYIHEYLKVPNLKFIEIGAGSDLDVIAKAVKGTDIVCCIRYSPVALKTDTLEQIKEKTESAIRAFGGDEQLVFSCVGIDSETPNEQALKYLSVFREERK